MPRDDVVLVDVEERIAVVTMNRPEARNALNRELGNRLPRVMMDVETRDDVDIVILTGTDPAFCAGVDFKELGTGEITHPELDDLRDDQGRFPWRGPFPPRTKPIIGAVNGPAVTGGFELALGCDLLIASERARFADTHALVGIMPGWGLTIGLVQSVGARRARELSLTGNYLDAQTALTWGLVNHVVPHRELLDYCKELARAMIGIDQRALRRMLKTYEEIGLLAGAEAWELEGQVSRDWMAGFDAVDFAGRSGGIMDRGRSQMGEK